MTKKTNTQINVKKKILECVAKSERKSLNGYVIETVDKQLISTGNSSILDTKEGE